MMLLTACAAQPVPELRVIEIPRPIIQRIPDQRIEPLSVPVLPFGPVSNQQLAESLGACLDTLHESNLDRAWLRARQNRKGE